MHYREVIKYVAIFIVIFKHSENIDAYSTISIFQYIIIVPHIFVSPINYKQSYHSNDISNSDPPGRVVVQDFLLEKRLPSRKQ